MSDNEDITILDITPADTSINLLNSRHAPRQSEPNDDDEITITGISSTPQTQTTRSSNEEDDDDLVVLEEHRRPPPPLDLMVQALIAQAQPDHRSQLYHIMDRAPQRRPILRERSTRSFVRQSARHTISHGTNGFAHPTTTSSINLPNGARIRLSGRPFDGIPEQLLMRMTLLHSANEYYGRTVSNGPAAADIKSVDVPTDMKTSEDAGYTSKIVNTGEEYCCALCGTELGVGFPESEDVKNGGALLLYRGLTGADRELSKRYYFAHCGHVYCGWCVSRFINRKQINTNNANSRKKRPNREVSVKRRKTNDGDVYADGNSAVVSFNETTPDGEQVVRLVNLHIPASCVAPGCKKQIRAKSFKEFFL